MCSFVLEQFARLNRYNQPQSSVVQIERKKEGEKLVRSKEESAVSHRDANKLNHDNSSLPQEVKVFASLLDISNIPTGERLWNSPTTWNTQEWKSQNAQNWSHDLSSRPNLLFLDFMKGELDSESFMSNSCWVAACCWGKVRFLFIDDTGDFCLAPLFWSVSKD